MSRINDLEIIPRCGQATKTLVCVSVCGGYGTGAIFQDFIFPCGALE